MSDPAAAADSGFVHPQATHRSTLRGHAVAFLLRRAPRRSIGFLIGSEGLAVSAPRWVTLAQIDEALQAKADWIVRKLQEQRDRAQRESATRVAWRDGAVLPWLGAPLTLRLDAGAAVTRLDDAAPADAGPDEAPRCLRIALPADAEPARIRAAAVAWFKAQARQHFAARCAHYAARLGVRVRRIALSSARTRWGCASADGSIRLHWRLVHFEPSAIDYVVAHELAHLRVMNHSPAFWALVGSVINDVPAARRRLRTTELPEFG